MGTTPRFPPLAIVLLYAGTGSACRESDHEAAVVGAISRIDSAGVVIVDHGTVSSAAARHGWRVDAAPVMTIGSGSAAAQALYRVKGGLFLGDSVVVVADGGSQQLRYFDRGGGVFAIAGGKGGGPGEFTGLSSVHRTGEDAITAFDWKLRKFVLYDDKGDFRRSWLIPAHIDDFLFVVGATAYGDVVTHNRHSITPSATPYTSQPPRLLLRLSARATAVDTIGEFPGPLRYHGPGRAVITVSFTARTEFAVGPDYFVAGYSADPEVRTFDLEGHLRRVVRWPRAKREVLPRHVEAEKDRIAKEIHPFTGAPSWFRQMSDQAATYLSQNLPFPTHFPVYDRLVIDGRGYLWVAPYPRPGERADPWMVFDGSGELVGEVSMPDDVVVLDIGVDYVLGLHLDDFDVEYVSLFAIEGRKP